METSSLLYYLRFYADVVDFIHASALGVALIIMISEYIFDFTIPIFNSFDIMRRHEMPTNRDITNLEHYWFRSAGSFRVPIAIIEFMCLFRVFSHDQRKLMWFVLVLYHFFEAIFMHVIQIIRPTPGRAFVGVMRHRRGAILHLLAVVTFSLFFLYLD